VISFWSWLLIGWFLASLVVGLICGKVFKGFNSDFDHAEMVDRAREQRRKELSR